VFTFLKRIEAGLWNPLPTSLMFLKGRLGGDIFFTIRSGSETE
jgi:hypothetical protein